MSTAALRRHHWTRHVPHKHTLRSADFALLGFTVALLTASLLFYLSL